VPTLIDAPFELDPAAEDASVQRRLCEETSNSGVFEWYEYEPVAANEKHNERKRSLQSPSGSKSLYVQRQFDLVGLASADLGTVTEYLFVCPIKIKRSDGVVSHYVSKAYDLQHDLRFVFLQKATHTQYTHLMVAEKSAESYTKPDFDVELHYLELRKHHRPGTKLKSCTL
jgi:hypothetical protein